MMRLFARAALDHLRAIGIQMDHRLLAIDILARLHRIHRDLLVPMVGSSDDDGVDIFALQDLGVVAGGKNIVAPEFLAVLEPAVITIGHGNKLDPGNLHRDLGISLALTTGTDQRESECGRWLLLAWPVQIGPQPANGFSNPGMSPPLRRPRPP